MGKPYFTLSFPFPACTYQSLGLGDFRGSDPVFLIFTQVVEGRIIVAPSSIVLRYQFQGTREIIIDMVN